MNLHVEHLSGSFLSVLWSALGDSLIDALKMLPILFLAYLLMEALEHRAGDKMDNMLAKVGKAGPLLGSLLGAIPQCGFSGAIASLYAGGVTTLGTMLAVFLSTSDEMIPLLLGNGASLPLILKLVLSKVIIGIVFGYILDLLLRHPPHAHIEEICEQDHGEIKEPSIFMSALVHTAKTLGVILAITFVLNLVFALGGETLLGHIFPGIPVVQEMLAALVGLIPSCSASVFLTELFSEGVLGTSALLAGLCTNAGVGLLVLFRQNRHTAKNFAIVGLLYLCGVLGGILTGLIL